MKTILVTGFEPFGGSITNPSQKVASALDGQTFGEYFVSASILPVDRNGGPQALLAAIDRVDPSAVVCLGEAARRAVISIERVAVNLMDYRIADNLSEQVSDQLVVEHGPAAYFSTLPVREIFQAMQAAAIPVELSLSAGAFLCNQVFYAGRHHLAKLKTDIPCGFIHLPALPEQAARVTPPFASMSFETSLHGIQTALATIAERL